MSGTGQGAVMAKETWYPPADGRGMAQVLNDAADQAWKTGEAINIYGDKIKEAAQKQAEEADAAMWTGIFGAFVAFVVPILGGALSLIGVVGRILASLVDVMATVAARIGNVAMTSVEVASGATVGAGMTLPFDLSIQGLADLAAGAPMQIDWDSEGWNIGLGGFLGGAFGGLAAYEPKSGPGGKAGGSPVPTGNAPGGGAPKNSPGGPKPGGNSLGAGPGAAPHSPPAGFGGGRRPAPGLGGKDQKTSNEASPNSP